MGTDAENHFFLLEALEQIVKLKAEPTGSVPKAFDVSAHDFRFTMESVPLQPMSLDLACAALEIMHSIVRDSELREFQALVVCLGMALGRFRLWFTDPEMASGVLLSNVTSFERGRLS